MPDRALPFPTFDSRLVPDSFVLVLGFSWIWSEGFPCRCENRTPQSEEWTSPWLPRTSLYFPYQSWMPAPKRWQSRHLYQSVLTVTLQSLRFLLQIIILVVEITRDGSPRHRLVQHFVTHRFVSCRRRRLFVFILTVRLSNLGFWSVFRISLLRLHYCPFRSTSLVSVRFVSCILNGILYSTVVLLGEFSQRSQDQLCVQTDTHCKWRVVSLYLWISSGLEIVPIRWRENRASLYITDSLLFFVRRLLNGCSHDPFQCLTLCIVLFSFFHWSLSYWTVSCKN